jgi:dihydrofolate reductase
MIRAIAAMDNKRGIADDHGIPWRGKLPTDVAHFREQTIHSAVLMGGGWYAEQQKPLPERRNLVATSDPAPLRPGFERVPDARVFLKTTKDDIWIGGGAGLFVSTLDLIDELDLTLIDKDFHCTKFFPEYAEDFEMVQEGPKQTENGITFRFTVWRRKT